MDSDVRIYHQSDFNTAGTRDITPNNIREAVIENDIFKTISYRNTMSNRNAEEPLTPNHKTAKKFRTTEKL